MFTRQCLMAAGGANCSRSNTITLPWKCLTWVFRYISAVYLSLSDSSQQVTRLDISNRFPRIRGTKISSFAMA